ncbi:3-oxoacyl-[acyl-carrier-protein] synthase II, chloroplastic-like isoform X2 [Tasmannia lanceolata]|uniref:3-oxoacyl-[acyl-carrier-protein] synthase II, chloroplastic-like isoform X2 n=1 Tax=Tasmannia lanceolata TaxID=3420 RepID=UPI004062BF57
MAIVSSLCSCFLAACVSRTELGTVSAKKRRSTKWFNKSSSYLLCKDHVEVVGLSSCFLPRLSVENGFQRFRLFSRKPIREQRKNFVHSSVMDVNNQWKGNDGSWKGKTEERKQRRVVVTGMGVVTSLGHDPDSFYDNLLEGKSGISKIESFDCNEFPTRIAGEIKSLSTNGWVAPKYSNRMDKFMLYSLVAGKKALADGGLIEETLEALEKSRCGVIIGTAMGAMKMVNDAILALKTSYKKINPFFVPFAATNMGSAMTAIDLGWTGPTYSIAAACATSNLCIISAANHIIRGEADVMLSGGSEAVVIPIGGFVACGGLSRKNEDPTKASRPWDMDRDGFVMGEGAGVLLLEELGHAMARGAEIYAEFLGGSTTCNAYHIVQPHPKGEGVLLCIEKALHEAGVKKEDVNYVNAHASSTKLGDIEEYQALIRCFDQNIELKINSTKSMIGDLLGAAGAVEAVATIQAIRRGWVHPTINLDKPEEILDMNLIVGAKKERLNVKVALSNSFGFSGLNSSILFAPFKEF